MNYFINRIKVNKIFHLEDFEIPIADESHPHLIITGKNGSGKTILLNAIADFLEMVRTDSSLNYLNLHKNLEMWLNSNANDENDKHHKEQRIEHYRKQIDESFGRVEIEFNNVYDIARDYTNGEFLFAYYAAYRKPQMNEPKNPTKPELMAQPAIKQSATAQFLNFLSDLKIQEALARNEGQMTDADAIKAWFEDFQRLLSEIYEDSQLTLEFDYRTYAFRINTNGKTFKFTELSDGYAAIIDIVADLILKMQNSTSMTRAYAKQGIVIIDEIETHLHLALQKIILPILTRVFPNIQFIVTTHSPFVLSSLPNAIAFDLEQRQVINDLTEYSYEALAEGYFGVKTESSYIDSKLSMLRDLLSRDILNESEKIEARAILADFNALPEMVSPLAKGEFRSLIIEHYDKIASLSV